jgi:DNA-binding NarL/FixJ family response regulator
VTIRILLADNHAGMRASMRTMIDRQTDMAVVAEAHDGQAAVRLLVEFKPNVVVMDINMADLKGADAARQIAADKTGVRFLALSMHANLQFVDEMIKAGAGGYLHKDQAFEELVRAIRTVADGRIYLCPGIEKSAATESG